MDLGAAPSDSPLVPRSDFAPALDPRVLHPNTQQAIHCLLKEGESPNTVRSYASALRYLSAWFALRYARAFAFPVPVAAVLQFLIDHLEHTSEKGSLVHDLPAAIDQALIAGGFKAAPGPLALNTVVHRLSVLSKAHQLMQLPSPTRDPAVQELLHRIRRAYAARGIRPRPKTALTREPLSAMLDTCLDDLPGIRDRAMLLFAFSSGGRRRCEVAAARMEDLTRLHDGAYLYLLARSKTDQAGTAHSPDAAKPLVGPAAAALTAWLTASGITSGALFRRIRRGRIAEPLAPQALAHIVQRRAALAGLCGDFAAHSLRSGFVTEAGRQNVPIREAMILTGHRSLGTFLKYFQSGAVEVSRAAHLMDAP